MQRQEWREIIGFPGYSVSNFGDIKNDDTEKLLRVTPNTRGIATVGMMRQGIQHKRSVSILVASAFILTARSLTHNTPINLDGDRLNNRVTNLKWRPKHIAVKYFQQFSQPRISNRKIIDVETGEVFPTPWEACIRYGLIETQVIAAIKNRTATMYEFRRFQYFDNLDDLD